MKEADAKVDHPHQMLLYVEKEDGSYGTVQTGSYMASNFMGDFQERQQYFHETNLKAVMEGKISPVAYYMNTGELTVPEVADRTGIRAGLVRRHMLPRYFERMSVKQGLRYAELFGIPIARLFAFITPSDPAWQLSIQSSPSKAVCQINIIPRSS